MITKITKYQISDGSTYYDALTAVRTELWVKAGPDAIIDWMIKNPDKAIKILSILKEPSE